MSLQHLVRFGVMGHVGMFESEGAVHFPRGTRVILRTRRGLETGEILTPPDPAASPVGSDGAILRRMTTEDQLLSQRLEQDKHRALEACEHRLSRIQNAPALIDVEHLFDGESLYFYFLGDVPPEVALLTGELAEAYEAKVKFRQFADALVHGCGPDCGTEDAAGGCDNCTTCALSGSCGSQA